MEKKINGVSIEDCIGFAFDGCHKIYLYRTEDDRKEFADLGYALYYADEIIIERYVHSCPLRFIYIYDSRKEGDGAYEEIVPQFCEEVVFEGFDTNDLDFENSDEEQECNQEIEIDDDGAVVIRSIEEQGE